MAASRMCDAMGPRVRDVDQSFFGFGGVARRAGFSYRGRHFCERALTAWRGRGLALADTMLTAPRCARSESIWSRARCRACSHSSRPNLELDGVPLSKNFVRARWEWSLHGHGAVREVS